MPSMEGRAAARPDDQKGDEPPEMAILQWRAGQLPGLTRCGENPRGRCSAPSMEGRAAARPDYGNPYGPSYLEPLLQWRAGQLPGLTSPSARKRSTSWTFNGGPGSCPA